MADLSTFDSFRDWLLGSLVTAVIGLIALVRKLDVGEISRRLERLESQVEKLQERYHDHRKQNQDHGHNPDPDNSDDKG